MQSNSFSIPVQLCNDTNQNIKTLALIDSGAGGKFINQNYARKLGVKIQKLEQPLIAQNVDGTIAMEEMDKQEYLNHTQTPYRKWNSQRS